MTIPEGEAYDNLMRDLTNVTISFCFLLLFQSNTDLINDANANLKFNNIEQLEQVTF